jgi:hypothetical protein
MFTSPNQQQSLYMKSVMDSYNYCTSMGFTTKFSKSNNFKHFSKKVLEHLKDTSMDTISYLLDPADSTKVFSVVTHHLWFTFASVCEARCAECHRSKEVPPQLII